MREKQENLKQFTQEKADLQEIRERFFILEENDKLNEKARKQERQYLEELFKERVGQNLAGSLFLKSKTEIKESIAAPSQLDQGSDSEDLMLGGAQTQFQINFDNQASRRTAFSKHFGNTFNKELWWINI